MELKELNIIAVNDILNEIIEYEMAGVVRYAHSSLMVTGPYRLPIVAFLQEQANESLQHALQAGELIQDLVDTQVKRLHLSMNHMTIVWYKYYKKVYSMKNMQLVCIKNY